MVNVCDIIDRRSSHTTLCIIIIVHAYANKRNLDGVPSFSYRAGLTVPRAASPGSCASLAKSPGRGFDRWLEQYCKTSRKDKVSIVFPLKGDE